MAREPDLVGCEMKNQFVQNLIRLTAEVKRVLKEFSTGIGIS
jgi:hypothetical protein